MEWTKFPISWGGTVSCRTLGRRRCDFISSCVTNPLVADYKFKNLDSNVAKIRQLLFSFPTFSVYKSQGNAMCVPMFSALMCVPCIHAIVN